MSLLLVLALLAQAADPMAEGGKALDAQDYPRALELFRQAVAADRTNAAAEFQLALTYNMMGNDAEAIPHYKAALAMNPEFWEVNLNLGLSMLRARDAAGAIPYLEAAAVRQSTPPVEAALARALSTAGRYAEAEAHFRKAATLDASHKTDLLELAERYEQAGKTAEAIAIYREFPDHEAARQRLGVLLLAAGKNEESIAVLERAATAAPTPANQIALAQAYLGVNQISKASAVAARAVASQPREVELRILYGRLLRDQRKLQDAATQFNAATALKPDSVEAWNELAAALANSEQYAPALAALDRLRGLGAETPGSLFYRALCLDHMGRYAEAVPAYNQFLAASQGKLPNQEFQARERARALERELKKK